MMSAFLWGAAFACWSIAALLIVSILFPDLLQRQADRLPSGPGHRRG
jgi:hypothetical protein